MGLPATFFEDVYEVVKLVPEGRVTTYGAIATYLGLKSSARMVGWAMNSTPKGEGIPAHRVVNRVGLLSGKAFFGEPDRMQRLLEAEGIVGSNARIVAVSTIGEKDAGSLAWANAFSANFLAIWDQVVSWP